MAGGKKSKRDGDRKKDKKRGRDDKDDQYETNDYDDEEEIVSNLDEKGISSEWSVPTAAAVNVEAKVCIRIVNTRSFPEKKKWSRMGLFICLKSSSISFKLINFDYIGGR